MRRFRLALKDGLLYAGRTVTGILSDPGSGFQSEPQNPLSSSLWQLCLPQGDVERTRSSVTRCIVDSMLGYTWPTFPAAYVIYSQQGGPTFAPTKYIVLRYSDQDAWNGGTGIMSCRGGGGESGWLNHWPSSPMQAHYNSGLDITPSSSAVLVTSILMLWALDHLLGMSCKTLIRFEVSFGSVHQCFVLIAWCAWWGWSRECGISSLDIVLPQQPLLSIVCRVAL